MLPRVRHNHPISPSNISIFSTKTAKNNRVKKVLKKENLEKDGKSKVSYFIRIIKSGFWIIPLVLCYVVYRQFLLAQIDIDSSYTRVFVSQYESHIKGMIVSLRGKEKGISVTLIEPEQLVQSFPEQSVIPATEVLRQQSLSAIALQLGIPVDEIVSVDSADALKPTKNQILVLSDPFSKLSNISFVDKLKIWWYVFQLDPSLITFKELGNSNGDEAFSVSDESQLNLVKAYFADTFVRAQSPTIAIVNTTEQNGLGKRVADVLDSWGFQVIRIDSSSSQLPQSTVVSSGPTSTRMIARISQLFGTPIEHTSDQNVLEQYRSQIVLFVGNDILR